MGARHHGRLASHACYLFYRNLATSCLALRVLWLISHQRAQDIKSSPLTLKSSEKANKQALPQGSLHNVAAKEIRFPPHWTTAKRTPTTRNGTWGRVLHSHELGKAPPWLKIWKWWTVVLMQQYYFYNAYLLLNITLNKGRQVCLVLIGSEKSQYLQTKITAAAPHMNALPKTLTGHVRWSNRKSLFHVQIMHTSQIKFAYGFLLFWVFLLVPFNLLSYTGHVLHLWATSSNPHTALEHLKCGQCHWGNERLVLFNFSWYTWLCVPACMHGC